MVKVIISFDVDETNTLQAIRLVASAVTYMIQYEPKITNTEFIRVDETQPAKYENLPRYDIPPFEAKLAQTNDTGD